MTRRSLLLVAVFALITASNGETWAGPADAGSIRLPPRADLVLLVDTGQIDGLLRGWFDDLAGLPIVKKHPWLAQQLATGQQLFYGGLAALTMQTGFDPLKDVALAWVALRLEQRGEPAWVIGLRGKLPAGLLDRLPAAGEKVMLGRHAARRTGPDELAVMPEPGLLVFGNRAGLGEALAAGRPGRELLRRHPLLARSLGKGDLLAFSLGLPPWLADSLHAQPDLKPMLPLLAGLERLELEAGERVELRVRARDARSTAAWRRLLGALAEMTVGGHHVMRAYGGMMLALDMGALPGVPPPVKEVLADGEALEQTLQVLLPPRPQAPALGGRGRQVSLSGRAREFAGMSFVSGILAAVAIPAFITYTRKAKLAEGYANLKALQVAEERYKLDHGTYLACGPHPAQPPPGGQAVAWGRNDCFAKLGFNPGQTRFSYRVELVGKGFEIEARADLDGDGRPVTLRALSDGGPVVREPPEEW